MRHIFLIIIVGHLVLAGSPIFAHRPEEASEQGITTVPNATTSFVYYRELTTAQQVDVYQMTAKAGQFFHVGLNIPQIKGLEEYGVSLALLGPGLPPVETDQLPAKTADLLHLDKLTGIVQLSQKTEDFYEPFTQTRYWGRQEIELKLPAQGTYFIIVWQPADKTGKYVIDTGTAEVFGPGDIFRFPIWWINIHVYFEHTPYLIGAATLLILMVIALILYRHRRIRRVASSSA